MGSTSQLDELTTPARIRQAAMELFGQQGFQQTTVRQIAARAGVAVGLVNHHFGTKDGLRTACDDWMRARIERDKSAFARGWAPSDLQAYVDDSELRAMTDYVVATLRDGGEPATRMFDWMVGIAETFFTAAVESGTMRAVPDPAAAAAVLTAYSAGASLMGDQIARRLGGSALYDPGVYERYAAASLDLFVRPLLSPEFPMGAAVAGLAASGTGQGGGSQAATEAPSGGAGHSDAPQASDLPEKSARAKASEKQKKSGKKSKDRS